MSYIDKNLLSDEKIIFRTRKHKIVFFLPVVLTIFAFYSIQYMESNPFLVKVIWAPWVVAAVLWIQVGLDYLFSEFAVTNKRVMMREGFFIRHANEMRINTISQVNIDQNLIGVILNYGTVSINAFGAYDSFPMIAKPAIFRQNVNEQLEKQQQR